MSAKNNLTLIGRLTKDSEMKYTSSGFAVSEFSIAVDGTKKSGDSWEKKTDFFNLALLGKRAESLNQYLTKGSQISVQGELVQETWEKDGKKQSRIKVNVKDIALLGGSRKGEGSSEYSGTVEPVPSDDEIPF